MTIYQHVQRIGAIEPFNLLVAIPSQSHPQLVVCVVSELMPHQHPSTGSSRQTFHLGLLGQVRRHTVGLPARFDASRSNGQAADALSGGDVAVEQGGRKITNRHIIKPMTGLIPRQPLDGIHFKAQ